MYPPEQQEMTICRTTYQPKEETAEAVSVDVTFSQECSKQMVTVCTPQAPSYGGYHGHGGAQAWGYLPEVQGGGPGDMLQQAQRQSR